MNKKHEGTANGADLADLADLRRGLQRLEGLKELDELPPHTSIPASGADGSQGALWKVVEQGCRIEGGDLPLHIPLLQTIWSKPGDPSTYPLFAKADRTKLSCACFP